LHNYLDNTYTSILYDYNANIINDYWYDPKNVYNINDAELYKFTNIPITIDENQYIMF